MTVPPSTLSDSRIATIGARAIAASWTSFSDRFRIITRRARLRFESRDWRGLAADHVERLDLYTRSAAETADRIRETLGDRLEDRMLWAGMKAVYSSLVSERPDWDLAETFFNSVTRRIFSTVGVDPKIEFVESDAAEAPPTTEPVYRTYDSPSSGAALVRAVLEDVGFKARFRTLDADAEAAGEVVEHRLRDVGGLRTIDRAEFVMAPFFRGKAAYLVGRVSSGSQTIPVVLALLHPPEGIAVDACLVTENQASIVFSFTRSYFSIDAPSAHALVHFLSTLMPRKRRAELYISIGYNKHGKTELYRELRRHLAVSGDRFVVTRGTVGLVMVVFTLPGFDVVVKVIRDTFGAPKQLTRDRVLNRYRLVFRHDRAGRLVDAQEYEHLEFGRDRFAPELLEILRRDCSRTVTVGDDTVAVAHAYVERRVTPLDVFLAEAEDDAAERAIVDYGQAIKDLAASGIFPGDMLLKNFGVTRHGRVVFYDYDELTTLSEVRFRKIPPARSIEDEMSAEPWFSVGPGDVFPEEFATFLGLEGRLEDVFREHHEDLFEPETWRRWQGQVGRGELIEVFPYRPETRFEMDA